MDSPSLSLQHHHGDDDLLLTYSVATIFLLSLSNIAALSLISAPYGKLSRPGWGPSLPSALAWSLMESPTLWLPALLTLHLNHHIATSNLLPLALFLLHYLNRTLLYPLRLLRLSPPTSPVPLSVAFLAFSFNVFNAFLQTRALAHPASVSPLRAAVGSALFLWGMSVNVRSDAALLRLRREGKGYRLPSGGWFEFVCCPNYMGEVVEWLGWAVVAWTPAAFGFFVYTCSNLVQRARHSRSWYREKFGEDFPESRKAIVPFLY